jgi:thymidylate synthase
MVEKLEYIYGTSSVDRICFYNKNMRSFANETTGEFDGAYGPRIRKQINTVIELLKKDPSSRQAVININKAEDKKESKDIPCTIALQVFIRGGKLDMVAYMRSNDILWGTPYDVNAFCFIQEVLAFWLGVGVGTYTHCVGSIHAYMGDEREQLLKTVSESNNTNGIVNTKFNVDKEAFDNITGDFWSLEYDVRHDHLQDPTQDKRFISLPDYFKSSILTLWKKNIKS